MEWVINHHTVHKHLVLHWRTAANIKLSALIPGEDDAWKYLKILCNIGLSAHSRYFFYLLWGDVDNSSLDFCPISLLFGRDIDSIKLISRFMDNEFEVLEFSRFYADVLCERIISDCSHNESVISWWNLSDSKISIHIGCTSVSRFLQIDIGEY